MSRGLGPAQLLLLRLAAKPRGEPVGYVAEHLGVSERRARKAVDSLRERNLVVVIDDPDIGRRVWTPAAFDDWERNQRFARYVADALRTPNGAKWGVICERCGHFVETTAPARAKRTAAAPETAR